ncbi:TetR/AcrR family transcriptional regulator [Riemerella anatipestifer]|uniref:TetR/AcrR family transcriptional regulator n=1 Tax=Riemerella anatipestifer TaxID=34085 RepID=A0AAP3EYB1_RIEAN|nr:TetR/AcrR family transcriptional regulator [Riemerella anatipestifer]AZZ58458.1 TetR/AcrR family transcriptional regulator [Riemerella anatipestifer]MBT0573102.1 TetR/AcrR family transcriptional regulator [Riemerella anatipestifer]MCO7319538.1 TetR/AcrR family transcriptional regulator [Riemerella anatipestifer]MCQ4156007.1 TetR/AcrR family transcriptional regulator [Riemerella anatipestifer]MCQ4181896.1 TetR/AcrR family transcriptional regulator [Riemerella anatipestifer]
MEKKNQEKRKRYSGSIRDKARTQKNLIEAVGKVLESQGYTGLKSAKNIADVAGVDKRLIWTYFNGVENLVEEYIKKNEFWKEGLSNELLNRLLTKAEDLDNEKMIFLLKSHFEKFRDDTALQKIITWEISEENEMLRKVADRREQLGEQLFSLIDEKFAKSNVDIRGVVALLLGGTYYLNLHAKANGSLFCGVDLNTEEGKNSILNAIEFIVNSSFDKLK